MFFFLLNKAYHAHTQSPPYRSPFRMVHIQPSIRQSLHVLSGRLVRPVDDFLVRHSAVMSSVRLICILSLLLLLLLSARDLYRWARFRHRRDRTDRILGRRALYTRLCEGQLDEKGRIIRPWPAGGSDGLPMVAELDVGNYAVTRHGMALVVEGLAPGAFIRVPGEPVLLVPQARGVDFLASKA